jgi:hypothetical protein
MRNHLEHPYPSHTPKLSPAYPNLLPRPEGPPCEALPFAGPIHPQSAIATVKKIQFHSLVCLIDPIFCL